MTWQRIRSPAPISAPAAAPHRRWRAHHSCRFSDLEHKLSLDAAESASARDPAPAASDPNSGNWSTLPWRSDPIPGLTAAPTAEFALISLAPSLLQISEELKCCNSSILQGLFILYGETIAELKNLH